MQEHLAIFMPETLIDISLATNFGAGATHPSTRPRVLSASLYSIATLANLKEFKLFISNAVEISPSNI